MNSQSLERRIAGGSAIALLVFWTTICITDVNHPPGTRLIRLTAVAAVLAVMMLEAIRPWYGFYLYLLFWPQALPLREFLGHFVSPLFAGPGPGGLPDLWAGGMTCALAVGLYLRAVSLPLPTIQLSRQPIWVQVCRVTLWVFVASWLLSAITGYARLSNPPASWLVDPSDWRHLLVPSMSQTNIVYAIHSFLPAFLLGILSLNLAAHGATLPSELRTKFVPPARTFALLCGCAGILVGIQVLWQMLGNWTWHFSALPLSGPFTHRNTTGPVLVLAGFLFLLALWMKSTTPRIIGSLGAGFMWSLAFATTSRNAVFMLVAIPWLALLIRAIRWRLLAATAIPAMALLFFLYFPFQSKDTGNATLNRVTETLVALREGNWTSGTSARIGLWKTAFTISKAYPLTGVGPGSFPMLAHPASTYRNADTLDAYGSAHSLPINLLAETGPVPALAWLLLFVIGPFMALLYWKTANSFALAVLLVGVANFFDTVMLVSGMTTLSVMILIWGVCEETFQSQVLDHKTY